MNSVLIKMKCIQTLVYCIVWVSIPPNYGKAEKVTAISDPEVQSTIITENGVKILSSDLLRDLHRTTFQKFDENQPLITKRIDELIKPPNQLEFFVTTSEVPFDNPAYPYHYKRSYHYSYPLIAVYDSYLDSQINRKSPKIYQSEYTFGPKTTVFTKKPYVQEVAAVKAKPKTNITNSTFANYQNLSWKSPNLGVLLGTHNSNHPPSIRESYENLNYYQSFSLPDTTSASLSYSEGVTTTNSLNENFPINKDEIPRNYSSLFPTYIGDFHLPGYDSTPPNNIPVQAIEGLLFSGNFEKEYSVKKPYLGLYTIPGPIYPTQLGVQDSLNPLTPRPSTSSQNLESSASVKSVDVNITKIEEKDLLGRKSDCS